MHIVIRNKNVKFSEADSSSQCWRRFAAQRPAVVVGKEEEEGYYFFKVGPT